MTIRGRKRAAREPQLQLDLRPRTWGGAREGAGRKKTGRCLDVPHRARAEISRHHPLHVVLRTRKDVPRLRRGPTYRAIRRALQHVLGEHAFRVVHMSIQHNHLHFLVEADDKAALRRGMRSLTITAAIAINRVLGRSAGHRRVEFGDDGSFKQSFVPVGDAFAGLMIPIVESAAEALVGGELLRVRRCADGRCPRVFYDSTRNGRRRWCDMATCGNRAKAARFRARERDVTQSPVSDIPADIRTA